MSAAESVDVIAFPGAPNLPIFAALQHGMFDRRGIDVSLELTRSSIAQAERCAEGEFDIACTAFDNVVAYSEGVGAAGPDVDPQYVAVMGATQLELSLIAAPDIKHHGDLQGRPIAVDALATGFAFVLYEMLARAGVDRDACDIAAVGATPQRWHAVRDGTYAATLTLEPFTSLADGAGFTVLDRSSRLFESYQGGVVAARGPVLTERPEAVRGFIHGYLDGLAWTLDATNREAAGLLLMERMDAIQPQVIDTVMDSLLSPRSGLTPDGGILQDGVTTVLDLRSRYGGRPLDDMHRYLDLSQYLAAMSER